MKKDKLDSFIKKAVEDSSDYYYPEAELAKERVWSRVKTQKRSTPLFYRVLAVASILLLIFLSSSVYFNLKYKSKINDLVETNTILKSDKEDAKINEQMSTALSAQQMDTVYIEKKRAEPQQIAATKYITDTVYVKQIVYLDKKEESKVKPSNEIASNSKVENKTEGHTTVKNDLASHSNAEDKAVVQSAPTDEIASNPTSVSQLNENTKETAAIAASTNAKTEVVNTTFQKDIIIKSDDIAQKKKKRKIKIKFGRTNSNIGTETLALSTTISK